MASNAPDLSQLSFADATLEQFEEFWESEGWSVHIDCPGIEPGEVLMTHAVRVTVNEHGFSILLNGEVEMGEECALTKFTTFTEAVSALNELAATKIMGGWAE